jgi:hypothetical protein
VARSQDDLPFTTIPPYDIADKRHPLLGGRFRRF